MQTEYIRKQDAVNAINEALKRVFTEHVGEGIINPLEPADVAPVVRCKDCKFCCRNDAQDWCWCERGLVVIKVRLDDFCSCGERREE